MTKNSITRALLASLSAIILAALFCSLPLAKADESRETRETKAPSLLSEESEKIIIASSSGTEYKLYFSADGMNEDQELAKEIQALVLELYGCRMRPDADIMDKASEKEVLIGNTNRKESATLREAIEVNLKKPDDLVWGYAVINGKLLYTGNCDEAIAYGAEDFLTYLIENSFSVPRGLLVTERKSRAEYDAEVAAAEEEARRAAIETLIEINNSFSQSQFGGEPRHMPTDRYNAPKTYPTRGQHPRMFITEDKLGDVLEILASPKSSSVVSTFWKEADKECDGKFIRTAYDDPAGQYANWYGEDWFAYDEETISVIQNKAFASLVKQYEAKKTAEEKGEDSPEYISLMSEAEKYGYEAIVGAKNMLLTLCYSNYLHVDIYHGASHLMTALAKIYDWCYWLMNDDDKMQIIGGVSNILAPNMESGMRFPPSGMTAVSGHGTGPQFLRDWVSVAISFYDEIPDWWDFVGGRYYQEYVPALNASIEGGWVSQGTAVYGPGKLYDATVSARLIYLATGQFPYDEESIKLTVYYMMSHIQPNNMFFQTGDGPRNPAGKATTAEHLYDIAVCFPDPLIIAHLYSLSGNMSSAVTSSWSGDFPAAKVLAYLAYLKDPYEGNYYEKVDTVQYFGGHAGSMTARSDWSSDAAAVLMKIGTRTLANHDILDHGTFQIYYKGMLAGTSGAYEKYGSNVHQYYLQSTVAHNGILVVNPAFADDTPKLGSGGALDVKNGRRYFYSGGQRARSEAGSLSQWLSSEYDMGEITGHAEGYAAEGESEYGYIAGDITKAYDQRTVSFLERRMLTVFTGDPDYPMLFFTFDTIEAVDPSFNKTFLLHTVKEPTVDTEKMTATVQQNSGRLFVQSLYGADSLEKVGDSGQAFWINGYYNADGKYIEGKNCVDLYCPGDYASKMWGRIQFHRRGEKQTQMLTAMYVTDAYNEECPEFSKFETGEALCADFGGIYTVFLKSRERQTEAFSLSTEGKGLSKYYINGIGEGLWTVKADGIPVATVLSDVEGGFVSFIAPSGEVSFEPASTASSTSTANGNTEEAFAESTYTEETKISEKRDTGADLSKKSAALSTLVAESSIESSALFSLSSALPRGREDEFSILLEIGARTLPEGTARGRKNS